MDTYVVRDTDVRVVAAVRALRGDVLSAIAEDLGVEVDVVVDWADDFISAGRNRLSNGVADELRGRVDRLLRLVAHELRTPLSSIQGWLNVLERSRAEEAASDELQERAIAELARGTKRLRQVVADLVDTTDVTLGRPRVVHTVVDLAAVADLLTRDDERLTLDAPDRVAVLGDPDSLYRMGERLLSAARLGTAEHPLHVSVRRTERWGELIVLRPGASLAPDTLRALMDPFGAPAERFVPSFGLHLAKAVAVAHGGYLTARSTDEGTTFCLRLPQATPRNGHP